MLPKTLWPIQFGCVVVFVMRSDHFLVLPFLHFGLLADPEVVIDEMDPNVDDEGFVPCPVAEVRNLLLPVQGWTCCISDWSFGFSGWDHLFSSGCNWAKIEGQGVVVNSGWLKHS